ncbi:MAG: hypothetical protein GEU71_03690 [Actinobacteria bacterium]|nr:hypothetical protein [Actinomycetota bacterium]
MVAIDKSYGSIVREVLTQTADGLAERVSIAEGGLTGGGQVVSDESVSVVLASDHEDVAVVPTDGSGDELFTAANPGQVAQAALLGPPVSGVSANIIGTTSTQVIAAQGAGVTFRPTLIVITNRDATVGGDVLIQDGSGGTTLLRLPVPVAAASDPAGIVVPLPTPLATTANTGLFAACQTDSMDVYVSASGYTTSS